ncbi:MAG: B12-binding domain-containing radical SAM protein, partial [Planctomycetota bacterium]
MKILLISPCQDLSRKTPGPLQIPQVALQLLAGMTPEEHEIQIVEEEFVDLDLTLEPDLVGLSLMTANAPRGYEIADHFRAKGAKVVLGGIHPTILPDEGLQHADSVVVGEGEEIWPEVVSDAVAGRLKPIYKAETSPDLGKVP